MLRDAVELVLPGGRVDRRLEDVLGGRGGLLRGQLADPARLGELGRPGDVHAEQVHARVLGGEPAHELVALAVGVAGQQVADDGVATGRLLVAGGDDLVELRRAGAAVQVDRRRPPGRSSRPRARSPAPPRRPSRPTGMTAAAPPSVVESSSTLRPGETLATWRSAHPRREQCQMFRVTARRDGRLARSRFLHIADGAPRKINLGRRPAYQVRPRCARVASISSRWTASNGRPPGRGDLQRGAARTEGVVVGQGHALQPQLPARKIGLGDARVVATEPAQVGDELLDRRPHGLGVR